MTSALLEALLAPISSSAPAGVDESYSPQYDEIRKLRKGDDPTLSQGDWVREFQTPQWPKVRDLSETILKTRSKDLQAACWYAEAMTYIEGFPGLFTGLKVLEGLLAHFGDPASPTLFPQDQEERIAKIEWFNAQMPMVIKNIPMTSPKVGGYSYIKWQESRLVENAGVRDAKAREAAIAEGKLSGEAWDKAATASGQAFYLRLFEQIQAAQGAFVALEKLVDQQFAQDAPGLEGVKEAIQGCADLSVQMMKRFGLDPSVEAMAGAPTLHMEAPTPSLLQPASSGGPIASRADAIRRLREVAKYFRDHEPHSPVGPLAERAARWGEMPLEQWLTKVIKDESTLGQLRDLLDVQPEL